MIKAGIWINRHRAVVIHLFNDKESVSHFQSALPDDAWAYGQLLQHGDQSGIYGQRAAKYEKQLHKFFKKVAFSVKDAEQIFIFGPDIARVELKKEIKKTKDWDAKILGVERADEMSDQEMTDKVRAFFKSSMKKGIKNGKS